MMPSAYKKLHPRWTVKSPGTIFGLVITPDLDSLLAVAIHRKMYPDDPIIGFYDFRSEYILIGDHAVSDVLYVDANMARHKCWGNHPTYMVDSRRNVTLNGQSSNLNLWFGPQNVADFARKVHFSTSLHMFSFYEFDLSGLDEEGLATVLMLDGTANTFLGDNGMWKSKDRELLQNVLGYGFLADVAEDLDAGFVNALDARYGVYRRIWCEPDSEKNPQTAYRLRCHINLDGLNGLFKPLGIRLELPDGPFRKTKSFEVFETSPHDPGKLPAKDKIYSCAWLKKDKVLYSVQRTLSQI